jgi:hypothetical protein
MFVQIIEGKVRDKDKLRSQLDKWHQDIAPGATGYLGSTGGVAADGTFIGAVRFESAEAAQANSDRPEQGAWFEETAQGFEGEARFADCSDVDTIGRGGSDDAGFVQVIQGTGDRDAMRAAAEGLDEFFARVRPDVLGGYVAWEGGGRFTQIVYFSSESEARKGEQERDSQMSPEDTERMNKLMSAVQFERYIDLPEPWLRSA